MTEAIAWLEQHEELSGWAQAIGAMVAIVAAFLVAHLQARYALRHDDRRTADRLRALARLFLWWRTICRRSYAIREHESQKPDVNALRENLAEFNHTASEINKFSFVDAPSESVLEVLDRYRQVCGPLSQFLNPEYKDPLPDDELKAFDSLIGELGKLAERLSVEAKRIGHR